MAGFRAGGPSWRGLELGGHQGCATVRVESTEGRLSSQSPGPASHQFFLVSDSSPPALPVCPGCLHLSQASCLSVPFLHQASTLQVRPREQEGKRAEGLVVMAPSCSGPSAGNRASWAVVGLSWALLDSQPPGRARWLPRCQVLGRARPKRRPRLRASGSCGTSRGLQTQLVRGPPAHPAVNPDSPGLGQYGRRPLSTY